MSDRQLAPPGHPLWELTVTRMKEALRDPSALFWTFGFPAFLAVVLGLAFRNAPVAPQPIGLSCAPAAASCGEVRARLAAAPRLIVRESTLRDALRGLRRSKLDLVLEVPAGDSAELVFHYDPSRREAQAARLAVDRGLDPTPPPFRSREQLQTEPGGRYIDFLLPGLVSLNLLGSGVWGVGFSIVDARRRKLLRQLIATPMKRAHFLLAYMLSRLAFLAPEVGFLFGFGALAFGTPILGSWWAIAVLSLAGALAFTGIGVLIAARSGNTEAAAGWANFVMMPMWLFSGVFFNYEQFPDVMQPVIAVLPLTALADALRAVCNEGASLPACAAQLAVLLTWAGVSFGLALKLFRWQ